MATSRPKFLQGRFSSQIKFQPMSFIKINSDDYQLVRDPTIRDVTLAVEHGGTAVDFYGNTKADFEITGKINRKGYGLSWGGITKTSAIVLGDDVKLSTNV